MTARTLPIALALAGCAGNAWGQLPPGSTALFRTFFAGDETLGVFDIETSVLTPVDVTSPQTTGRGVLDPATGRLLTTSPFSEQILSLELDGVALASAAVLGSVPPPATPVDVAVDANGDIVVISSQGALHRIDRHTGAQELLGSVNLAGTPLIEIDAVNQRMWIADSPITANVVLREYDLCVEPLQPTVLLDMPLGSLGGLSYDASREVLFLSTATVNSQLLYYDLEEELLVFYPSDTLPTSANFYLDYDASRDLIHLIAGDNGAPFSSDYYTFDPRAEVLELVQEDVGLTTYALAVNDLLDTTTVFPARPSAGEAFALEVAAHGRAGDLAAVFAISVNGQPITPIVAALGSCDSGGFLTGGAAVGAQLLGAGDTVTFISARLSQESGSVVFGSAAVLQVHP